MRKRLQYNGGEFQQSRMIEDKLKSLKKALLYSYQAGTMIIANPNYDENATEGIATLPELKFRCLMNPDKLTYEADKKMVSVPFEDICLNAPRAGKTTEGFVKVPIKGGCTFIWEETASRWLVVLTYLEELAYFRADVRRCFPHPLNINGVDYWFSSTGENQEALNWTKKSYEDKNKMNYTRTLYLERNSDTFNYFSRFKIIKIPNIEGELESWEVQALNPNSVDDILIVHVREYFENEFEDLSKEIQEEKQKQEEELGYDFMYVYNKISFSTDYVEGALWEIKNQTPGLKLKINAITNQTLTKATIDSMNGISGSFDLYYNNQLLKRVMVKSL